MEELIEKYKSTLRKLHGNFLSEEEIDKKAREIIESTPKKGEAKKSIGFAYYNRIVSEEIIGKMKKDFEDNGFNFVKKDKSNEVYKSLDDIITEILFLFGSEVTQAILLGAAGSGFWTLIVDWVKLIRSKIKGKKITKITGGKILGEREVELHIRFRIDEVTEVGFKIDYEIPESKIEEYLDAAKEIIQLEEKQKIIDLTKNRKRFRFDHNSEKWIEV